MQHGFKIKLYKMFNVTGRTVNLTPLGRDCKPSLQSGVLLCVYSTGTHQSHVHASYPHVWLSCCWTTQPVYIHQWEMQFSEDWVLITFSWILLPDLDKNKQQTKTFRAFWSSRKNRWSTSTSNHFRASRYSLCFYLCYCLCLSSSFAGHTLRHLLWK